MAEKTKKIKKTKAPKTEKKYPRSKLPSIFKKAYSAKFVIYNEETKSYEYVKFKNGSTSIPSIQKISQEQYSNNNNIWFDNPYDLYQPEKTHYDFQGWSLTPQGE